MKPINAIFWDSDNTVIDTFALHWAKHKSVLADHGIILDDQYKTRIHHNNGAQNFAWIQAELGLTLSEAEYLHAVDSYYAKHADNLKPMDGVLDILELAQGKKIPQVIVSNGRRASVETSQRAAKTINYFEFLICNEDYEGRKPEPAPFLTALTQLNRTKNLSLLPEDCLAIDDDPLGIESAKKAGMTTLFRPTALVSQTCEYADYTAHSTDEFIDLCRTLLA